jgi:hypothetical protein
MKTLESLKDGVEHERKLAIYAAEYDGKTRNFAHNEMLGECREAFSRLVQEMPKGEIGAIMTPDAACLSIETSPGWMELLIQLVKQHAVLIGDHTHNLVYNLREEDDEAQFRALYLQEEYQKAQRAPRALIDAIAQSPFAAAVIGKGENWFLVTRIEENAPDTAIYSLSSGANEKQVDRLGVGRWKEIVDHLATNAISEEEGWSPISSDQKEWFARAQQQEDTMAAQTANTMEAQRDPLPKGTQQVRVILPGTRKPHVKKKRK